MAVIKSTTLQDSDASSVSSVVFNLADVSAKAQSELNQVKLKAAEIVKQAQKDGEKIRQKAAIEGRQQAEDDARKRLKAEVDQQAATLLPALKQIVQELTNNKQQWMQQWERSAIDVAVAIAEKVIRREVEHAPQISATLIRETLQMAADCGEIHIRLNPQDLASMDRGDDMVCDELKKLASSQIIADKSVTRGGCLVETKYGSVDNRIESQLTRIQEELGGQV